jgi:cell division protein ZapA (FtsZ GTPase activity inhibitor)
MMSDLHSQIPDQPPVTLAVLSALNVSEELFHAQKSTNEDLRAAEQEIRALTRFMDETLAQ